MKTKAILPFIFLSIYFFYDASAQHVTITLRSEAKVISTMTAVNQVQLFTEAGIFAFTQIKSVSFWKEFPDSASIALIRNGGVPVYLKKERLAPIVKKDSTREYRSVFSFGLGLGLDYGGLGGKFQLMPSGPVGLFAGLGSNFTNVGYNFGLDIKFRPHKRNSPFITGMYGYNAIYANDVYYGFSAGLGGKFRLGQSDKDYASFMFVVPFRSAEVKDIINSKNLFNYPVLISFGFHFGF